MKLKIAFLFFFTSMVSFAQGNEKKNNNELTAPVIKTGRNGFDALKASRNSNLALIIYHGKNDPVSGEKYAKGFANGFTDPKTTNNKPIYITAVHTDGGGEVPTYVEVFMDGQRWNFKNHYRLDPDSAWKLTPLIMKDFVEKYGDSKIIKKKLTKQ